MKVNRFAFLILFIVMMSFQYARAANLGQEPGDSSQRKSGTDEPNSPESAKDAFERSYSEAENLRKSAARAGNEWLKTEGLLIHATDEADKGNWDEATRLIQTARFQAEAALRQAETESQAWKHRVIGNMEAAK